MAREMIMHGGGRKARSLDFRVEEEWWKVRKYDMHFSARCVAVSV